jgi:hypothetical protein
VPTSATRLVLLRGGGGLVEKILDWVWSAEPVTSILDRVSDELPSFDDEARADLLASVDDLSRTVAALTGLDLMTEVYAALEEQQGDGVAPEDFEPPDIDSAYGEDGWRLDLVAESNNQSAYARGKQDEDAGSDDWWEYVAQPDACDVCAPLDGTQAPQDDGIWTDRIPPLHPRCVCELKPIPAQKIRATEHDVPDVSRGTNGWGNPQKRFAPDLKDKPAALLPAYEDKLRNLRESE